MDLPKGQFSTTPFLTVAIPWVYFFPINMISGFSTSVFILQRDMYCPIFGGSLWIQFQFQISLALVSFSLA